MRKFLIITFIVLYLPNLLFGQSDSIKLKISHLTGDFYVFTTYKTYKGNRTSSNGMFVVSDSGVIMIDTPWDDTQFQPLLDSITSRHNKKVLMCIATHSHEDRTGGLEYYRQHGIKTFTTIRTDEICKQSADKRAEYLIANDTIFKVGKYSFQTYYPGQGHSSDNIVIWFGNDKILYAGCLIKSVEATDLGYLGDANTKEWGTSIKKVQNKFQNPKYIITGHQSWQSNKSIDHTLILLQRKEKTNKR